MKKVIAILGSRRKGRTRSNLDEIKGILSENDIELEIINLYDYNIEDCIGCERCLNKDRCFFGDDVEMIMDKLNEQADGIIMASPVYMWGVSGRMKTFIDRTSRWYMRPELYGRPYISLATWIDDGGDKTLEFLNMIGIFWGMQAAGVYGSTKDGKRPINKDKKALDKFIKMLLTDRKVYRPDLKSLNHFQALKHELDESSEDNKEYWRSMGWDRQNYYHFCKVSFLKRLFIKIKLKIKFML